VHPPDKSKLHPEVSWLLAAIKREERKLEKELGELQHQLNGVRAAAPQQERSAVRRAVRSYKLKSE
jgi:hypothetical protein